MADGKSKAATGDASRSPVLPVPATDLLARETTLSFAGLTPADQGEYPDSVSPEARCLDSDPRSMKDVIATLPQASSGELWATNEFVGVDGAVDTETSRDVHGLDVDALEDAAGCSLDDLATRASSDPLVRIRDHQDIVDERRKALYALGYDVKFRWQIASDRYSIINPQEAYLPIIGAFQQRGETATFGWASYRDWGGLLKMFVVCPGLEHIVSGSEDTEFDDDTDGVRSVSDSDETDLTVYGGFETGYDFRGTQTLWAKPILYFPETGTVVPDTGKRYTRRHYGRATDATHERANDRVPINEWWKAIYDDVDLLTRGDEPEWSEDTAKILENHPIGVIHEEVTGVQNNEDGWLKALEFEDGTVREYKGGFAMYGADYNNGLARELGCELNDDGTVAIDDHGQTSVEEVYAVGDLTPGHNQIPIALGDGAKAGISIHFVLRDFQREPETIEEAGPVRSEEVPGIPDELLEQAVAFHTYE